MPRPRLLLFVFLCCCLSAWAAGPEGAPGVAVTVDHDSALYEIGEKAVFAVTVAHPDGKPVEGKMSVAISLTNDGGEDLVAKQTLEIGATPARIEYTFAAPGFVRLTAIGRVWQGKPTYLAASGTAACEPEKIQPAVTMPDDFDAFWRGARERLAQTPLDLKQERLDHLCDELQDTYKVSFANVNDTRIYGYLLVPKAAQGKKLPALIAVAPAGVGKPREDAVSGGLNRVSRNQAVCLYMGVYDHDLGQPKEYYEGFRGKDGGIKAATGEREKFFFYRATLGIDRAIDWLAAREDVDPTRVVYTGGSQGGGMGLVLTGLNRHITAAAVNIPALCDHLGYQAGRQPGWPGVLGSRERRAMSEERIEAAARMLPYFDAVNFARKISVPVLLTMGYLDTTCPPSGVYAAYNVIRSPKEIITDPHVGHGTSPQTSAAIDTWVRRQLGLAEPPVAQGQAAPRSGVQP